MTERERRLEAVVEAAREMWFEMFGKPPAERSNISQRAARVAFEKAYGETYALPAPQPEEGETVEVWRVGDHYELTVPGLLRGNHCTRLGTTTLRLNAEVRT